MMPVITAPDAVKRPLLPYFDGDRARDFVREGEALLADIKSGLVTTILAADWSPGATFWLKQLKNYLDLKYPLSTQDRAHIGRLLFEIVVAPGMDPTVVETFAEMASTLLCEEAHLTHEDLQLPWRPLHALFQEYVFPSGREKAIHRYCPHLEGLVDLVWDARRFFPSSATEEILQTFLPTIHLPWLTSSLRAQSYLALFLPVEPPHAKPQVWLSTVFTLWSAVTQCPNWNWQWLRLVAMVAENQYGRLGLLPDMVDWCCNVGLREMNVPVGTHFGTGARVDVKSTAENAIAKLMSPVDSLAHIVVWSIYPSDVKVPSCHMDGRQIVPVDMLDKLSSIIQAIETFFHPSNNGSWTPTICFFLQRLAAEMWRRCDKETKPNSKIPELYRLTPRLRSEFVQRLRGVTFLSMFGKNAAGVRSAQDALKYLSWIQPNMLLPGLLSRVYPSLESLTEAHRTSSSISTLFQLSHTLFNRKHYPYGGKHVAPLLRLTLPGIDMNDPNKTISSLMFVANSLYGMPLWDLTEGGGADRAEWSGLDAELAAHKRDTLADAELKMNVEEEDRLCLAATGEFEDWVVKFLGRVFTIFDNLPQEARGKYASTNAERSIVDVLMHACEVVFWQLSSPLYDVASKTVLKYASETVTPNATKAIGLMANRLVAANPAKGLATCLALCHDRILDELAHGASSTPTVSSMSTPPLSDASLHWYQTIASESVLLAGKETLTHTHVLLDILSESWHKCNGWHGYNAAAKLFRHCIHSLTAVYPIDARSENPDKWNDEAYMAEHYLRWGQGCTREDLRVAWHVPSEKETDFAMELIDTFLRPAMKRLRALLEAENMNEARDSGGAPMDISNSVSSSIKMPASTGRNESTHRFCKDLTLVHQFLSGMGSLVTDELDLPLDGPSASHGANDDGFHEENEKTEFRRKITAGICFADGGIGDISDDKRAQRRAEVLQLRYDIGVLLNDIMRRIFSREDDVETAKAVIKCVRTLLTNRGIERRKCGYARRTYEVAKAATRIGYKWEKKLPRYLMVHKAYISHLNRLRHNASNIPLRPMHCTLINNMAEFCLSQYADVRKVAQNAVSCALACFPMMRTRILPKMIDAIKPPPPGIKRTERETGRMKGAIHMLSSPPMRRILLRNWRFIPDFMLTVCQAQHEDKPNVNELLRKMIGGYVIGFHVPLGTRNDPPEVFEVANILAKTLGHPLDAGKLERAKTKRQRMIHRMETQYPRLVGSLLDLVESQTLHWRFAAKAISLLDLLQNVEVPLNLRFCKVLTDNLVSELLNFRRGAEIAVLRQLYLLKRRTEAVMAGRAFWEKPCSPLKANLRVEESDSAAAALQTLMFPGGLELNELQYTQTKFVDKTEVGWLVWPYVFEAYSAGDDRRYTGFNVEPQSVEAAKTLQAAFTSPEFWKSFMRYMAEETNRGITEVFRQTAARLFKYIFMTFEDAPLSHVKAIVEEMFAKKCDRREARALAELLAGLVRGSKHWTYGQLTAMWAWLCPVLKRAFNSATPDTLESWNTFLRVICVNRDPRRLLPIVKLVLENRFDPAGESALAESKKLSFQKTLFTSFGWRLENFTMPLLVSLFDNMRHPYKQVRDSIGLNLAEMLQLRWHPSFPSVDALLESHQSHPSGGVGNVPIEIEPTIAPLVKKLVGELGAWRQQVQPAAVGTSDYTTAGKTVLFWLYDASRTFRTYGVYPFIALLLEDVFYMQDFSDQQDLKAMANAVTANAVQLPYPPAMIPSVMQKLLHITSTASSWRVRIMVLPATLAFFFRSLFLMKQEDIMSIIQAVSAMMMDHQLEVREAAAATLSGLVRCSQRTAIDQLKAQFGELASIKLPRRPRTADKPASATRPPRFNELLLRKHAGVLGLSCLVQAFPYEVPGWMPEVLVQIAACISDPNPIHPTVQRIFSDFRRTHYDTWHEDSSQFTDEQLSLLSDLLISPSYYA